MEFDLPIDDLHNNNHSQNSFDNVIDDAGSCIRNLTSDGVHLKISTNMTDQIDHNCTTSSNNNMTDTHDPFYFFKVEQLTFLGILLFVIVVGNLAVLTALALAKTQRKSRMNFFIMHLALADLSVGLINVSTDIIWKLTVTWYMGNFACKMVKYFQTVVIYSSNYVLVALSIDRYDAITHPLNFSGSWRRARILVLIAWVLSFVFATPAIYIFQETTVPGNNGRSDVVQCWGKLKDYEWQIYITLVFLVLFMIPAIIIAVCYTIMVQTIWTQSRILTPQSQTNNTTTSNGFFRKSTCRKTENLIEDESRRASSRGLIPKAKIKSVKLTFAIVFVFIMCSCPYFVFSLLQVYGFNSKTQTFTAFSTFFQSLSPLNSAANPIIYCLFSTHVCQNLRKIKFIDWLANKLCSGIGKPILGGSGNRRRFGPMNHQHDLSGKTRSDFTTSITDSLMRSAKSTQSSRFSTAVGNGNGRKIIDSTTNEVTLKPDLASALSQPVKILGHIPYPRSF